MKRAILINLLLIFAIACGKGSLSTGIPLNYSIEFKAQNENKTVHLLDRKIIGLEFDVRQPGMAILIITAVDRMQIGNKIHDIPWKISIQIQENSNFKLLK